MESDAPVVIVGGGLAGLSCANVLNDADCPFLILESEDRLGGKVRTDDVENFSLDRGFQVLQMAYPEAQRQLDYDALQLRKYLPGALIYKDSRFHRFIDPWRRPWDGLLSGLTCRLGSYADKLRIFHLRRKCRQGNVADLFNDLELSTREYLTTAGFSEEMVDSFFRPFLGGVFLERELETSSRMLMFVFRMFSTGDVSVPANGMQAIPDQMASRLPGQSIRTGCRVQTLSAQGVQLEGGEFVPASQIVVATPQEVTNQLLGQSDPKDSRRVGCFYFSAPKAPVNEPILVLNGEPTGPVNNLSVPSVVSPAYAPKGEHLISISVVDEQYLNRSNLVEGVKKQCTTWFGDQVSDWNLLKYYDIRQALPNQNAGENVQKGHARAHDGVIICGDHIGNGSIQSALASGRNAAEFVLGRRK